MTELLQNRPAPQVTDLQPELGKRGFMCFAFDEFARYYAPNNFNTPTTPEQILRDNDIQLFDLQDDPLEKNNLGRRPRKEQRPQIAHERVAQRAHQH